MGAGSIIVCFQRLWLGDLVVSMATTNCQRSPCRYMVRASMLRTHVAGYFEGARTFKPPLVVRL